MKTGFKVVGIIIALILLGLGLELGGVKWMGIIKPMQEEVRRDTFESSRAFNEGVIRDLADYHLQWERAEADDKPAIESVVRHRFPNYAIEDIPSGELRTWFRTVRGY